MKHFFFLAILILTIAAINAQIVIPKELQPEAAALKKDMESVGVRFIGDMPDPTSLAGLTPELKSRGEEFKNKLQKAGVLIPSMPGV